jgi:hypothetical protein
VSLLTDPIPLLRVPVAVAFVIIIVIFFFAIVFLFLVLIGLFPQENSDGNRRTRAVRVEASWIDSVHGQWYASQYLGDDSVRSLLYFGLANSTWNNVERL